MHAVEHVDHIDGLRSRPGSSARQETSAAARGRTRRRLAVFLAVVGPGLITSNVDNDAGGITTYTAAGAQFGYTLLWSLIPMTIALYVSEEMCARMGVVTGKGLSDLIREEFGFRSTFFVMLAAFAVDLGNTVAEFAGVAAAMQIFGISKYYRGAARGDCRVDCWWFAARTARWRRSFWWRAFFTSPTLFPPSWPSRTGCLPRGRPPCRTIHLELGIPADAHGLVGTTIAPWQFFYLQAGFVEKRVAPRQYKHARMDVMVGSISCMAIVFFIIVCTRRHAERPRP